jgi:hypothetical protein
MRRVVLVAALLATACAAPLPEAGSPGALVYARQCGECHRTYAPGSMTWPMWEYQLGRMKVLFSRLHRPWLSPEEERLMVDYLQRHAGGQA